MSKRTHIFNPGDQVSFMIGSSDYEGEFIEDDGGQEVIVEIDHLGNIAIFHTLLMLKED